MRIGLFCGAISDRQAGIDDLIEEARGAERDGFASYVVSNVFSFEAITVCALLGRETERIELATGVVPSPPRHPFAMAQQALTAQAACSGRFTLGIGLSHKMVIENMLGLSYARPARQMREYLEVLVPLVQGRNAEFDGDLYRVHAGLQVPLAPPVPVLVAALGPRMLQLTGELADGTATWMTGPRTLGEHTVPEIRKAASAAGRPEPRIVAALPIALTTEPDAAREVAGRAFEIYGALPSYRAMLDREGAQGPGDVALVGDENALRDGLARLRSAGVTDYIAVPFAAGEGAVARTRDFLMAELQARV